MKDKEKIGHSREIYLISKKGQFSAVKDGIPALAIEELRRLAVHWTGSQDATLYSVDRLRKLLTKLMNDPEKVKQVLDRIPKRCNGKLWRRRGIKSVLTMSPGSLLNCHG